MKIQIKVKPRAKTELVEKTVDGSFIVKVAEPAEGGWANQAVREALAAHFGVPKSSVIILQGLTRRTKLIEIR